MRRTTLQPTWAESPSDEIESPITAYATVTHKRGYRHVRFSGGTAREGDLAEDVRMILARRQRALQDLGGGLHDAVVSRYFVLSEFLTRENQARIDEVRNEFFDPPNLPASTMVGVDELFDEALVEIELEAEIPDDEWETTVMTEEDADR